jgi:hypothetical protein
VAITACPAAVVAAPVESVWELLAESALYDQWWDMHTERIVPAGPVTPGQVLYGTAPGLGRPWDVSIAVELVNPDKHQVRLLARLPFGITNQATITCRPRDATSCLLQFG